MISSKSYMRNNKLAKMKMMGKIILLWCKQEIKFKNIVDAMQNNS